MPRLDAVKGSPDVRVVFPPLGPSVGLSELRGSNSFLGGLGRVVGLGGLRPQSLTSPLALRCCGRLAVRPFARRSALRGKADIPDTPHQCSLMTHSGTCDQFHWTTSQLDCETRKLDTCLWNLAWYWRHKSAIRRCAFAHWFQLTKPLLRSVPTDKEASDGHQDRVAGT